MRARPAQQEYEQRLAKRQEAQRLHRRRESLAGGVRVAAFALILGAAYAWLVADRISPWWLAAAMGGFVAAVAWHRRVVRGLGRAEGAIAYYRRCLDRLGDRWSGSGATGLRYLRAEHPYAADLDLFGRGSLFQLLATVRTRMGQDTLAAWLLAPAEKAVIEARQAAIEEMRLQLDLRETLALADCDGFRELDPEKLRAWAMAAPLVRGWTIPALGVGLAIAAVVTLVGWLGLGWGRAPFLLVVVLEAGLLMRLWRPIRTLTRDLDEALAELRLLVQVLQILENCTFQSDRLKQLGAVFHAGGRLPSARIRHLAALAETLEGMRRNQFLAPIAFLLMLVVQTVYALERWRARFGAEVARWLDTVGEYEALAALGGYAYEHPGDPFAEIAEADVILDARELGHPLIPGQRCVRNDVRLGADRKLMLVSGSNMSGKSTLLRAVGTNTVLALAGAPVRAGALRVSPLAVGTAMRVHDSLQQGMSGFLAEISRVKQIVELASGRLPVLFLLDEILHGTNSHDRRIGAEAVIGELLDRGGMGLITTHDLALAEVADRLAPLAANVHFEDQMVDGRMAFDYRLRPGVVPKSNALALMRLLGLHV